MIVYCGDCLLEKDITELSDTCTKCNKRFCTPCMNLWVEEKRYLWIHCQNIPISWCQWNFMNLCETCYDYCQ